MARKPDTPCAGGCGRLLWTSDTSLPAGKRTCRECRKFGRGPVIKRACAVCGTLFRPGDRKQLTCSRTCGAIYRNAHHPPTRRSAPRPTCEVCGDSYRRSYPGQRTCGRRCGWALRLREGKVPARKPKPTPEHECGYCGVVFADPTSKRWRYCSDACAKSAARIRDLARRGKTLDDVDLCTGCGKHIPMGRKRCDDCKSRTVRTARRRRKRRDRARRRGVRHEPYTLAEIAARDHFTCRLCRKRVAMTKAVPHPKAPTIDHVLPIAAGGDDTRANVQLAHFECNWMKRDGGTQQLALVG